MEQVHKCFSKKAIREFFASYVSGKVQGRYVQEILGIKNHRFFTLLAAYKQKPL